MERTEFKALKANVLPVEVVRPKFTGQENAARFIGGVGWLFTAAWLLMLILGAETPFHPGYWETLLLFIGFKILTGRATHLSWTRQRRQGE